MDLTAMSVSSVGKVSTTKDRVAVGGSRMLCGPTMLILKAARPLVNNKGLPTALLPKGGLDPDPVSRHLRCCLRRENRSTCKGWRGRLEGPGPCGSETQR